jgi:hypothetical protein
MTAFHVSINGHRLCVAGIGKDGVMNTILDWIGNPGAQDILSLTVGGLDNATNEFVEWSKQPLKQGDELLVRIIEVESVDVAKRRSAADDGEAL